MKDKINGIALSVAMALTSFSNGVSAEHNDSVTTVSQYVKKIPGSEINNYLENINDVLRGSREIYQGLYDLSDRDYDQAIIAANKLRDDVLARFVIAEFVFQALPDLEIIRSMKVDSIEYQLCRAVAELRASAANLNSLVNQIVNISPEKESSVDKKAIIALITQGSKVPESWG